MPHQSLLKGMIRVAFVAKMAISPGTQKILNYIGANVRRLRVARGWTQSELAAASGLKERYVQVLETGTANPTARVLVDVAGALSVAPADLFEATKSETRRPGNPRL
jgi:transcriptional regulator with XRE-family HTH domain